jgi:nitrate reductase / nitrite oxidoreductase, alpha subunit
MKNTPQDQALALLMVRNVDPNIETLIAQDIEMTSDVNHNNIAFATNS